MREALPQAELEALERRVQQALMTGERGVLTVLSYGDIASVLMIFSSAGDFVCKRLWPFPDQESYERYHGAFDLYLEGLSRRGLRPVESELRALPQEDGKVVVYCLQPALPSEAVGHRYLGGCSPADGVRLFDLVLGAILRGVGETLGLQGQMSNWALHEGRLEYLDVTTPLIRDEGGADLWNPDLPLSSLAWPLRGLARRTLGRERQDRHYSPRPVVLDLLANLCQEGLAHLLGVFLERANERLAEPLAEEEVQAAHDKEVRARRLLERLRRMDRWWQRRVRRRGYSILLPPRRIKS